MRQHVQPEAGHCEFCAVEGPEHLVPPHPVILTAFSMLEHPVKLCEDHFRIAARQGGRPDLDPFRDYRLSQSPTVSWQGEGVM